MSKHYQWDHPAEWLTEKVNGDWFKDATELRAAIFSMLEKLDGDDLQDIFQSDMDDDGYFQPLPDSARPR